MPRTRPTTPSAAAPAWVVTGPTSGIGHRAALELAPHGTVVLVSRDRDRLDGVRAEITARGGTAVVVVADLSDVRQARRAAREVTALGLEVAGVLNNAGIFPMRPLVSAQGWDGAFATNHLGPFTFTETLVPDLPDGAVVVFVCSAVEDPGRRIAVAAGFRGARYVSAEASARGEWLPGGSTLPGADAYATSKQGNLATVLAFAREHPRLRFRGVEPGVTPGSNLGRDANLVLRSLSRAFSPVAPLLPHYSTPRRAARLLTRVLTDPSEATGVYYDEKGRPLAGSAQVRDPRFSDRYVAETRALLAPVLG